MEGKTIVDGNNKKKPPVLMGAIKKLINCYFNKTIFRVIDLFSVSSL